MWPNDRFIKLSGIELPIIQAPMAGSALSDMVVAVSQAGGLGSLACALLSVEQARKELETIRRRTSSPINANFFCHQPPRHDSAREMNYDLVMEFHPEVVSFHFGLPDKDLLLRVKSAGAKILSSATSVDEARWLEDQGCDAIIAQGSEAGGHRGTFLKEDVPTQVGTMA